MATCSLSRRFLSLLTGRLCSRNSGPARLEVRAFNSSILRSQLHRVNGTDLLTGRVDRFGGVTVNLAETGFPADISESSFSVLLRGRCSSVNSSSFRSFSENTCFNQCSSHKLRGRKTSRFVCLCDFEV